MIQRKTDDRRTRFGRVIASIQDCESFSAAEATVKCGEKSASFVSTILKQLTEDGVLERFGAGTEDRFCWLTQPSKFDLQDWIERRAAGMPIRNTPSEERPRERLLRLGAENLKTSELLAILIRTGRPGESAMEAGQRIANHLGERLETLRELSPVELKRLSSAVSESAYCQILAGVELGRRVVESIEANDRWTKQIDCSEAAKEYCRIHFRRLACDANQEEFHIVTLDTKLRPIANHRITIGTLDASLVGPREIFRAAIRDSAAAVLLVHNHPSGDPTPSQQDFQATDKLDAVAKVIGIQVIDHIVVGSRGEASIRDLQ